MQAVIIAGGKGSRLRPLTWRSPKPLLPLLDVPFLEWLIQRCQAVGLTDILLNVGYLGQQIEAHLGDGSHWGVQIRYLYEDTPLDTAGSLLLAQPYFTGESLVVFNADILTDLDLTALMAHHRQSGAIATLSLTRVSDITAYGLVEWDANQRILAFREKPTAAEAATITTDTINAGTYVLEPSVFSPYPSGEPLSFERQVFPELLAAGKQLSGYLHPGYWRDLGTPASYYQGQLDILQGRLPFPVPASEITPGIWQHPTAVIDPAAQLTAPCYVGAHTHLGPDAQLPAGTMVMAYCWVNRPLAPGAYAAGTLAA